MRQIRASFFLILDGGIKMYRLKNKKIQEKKVKKKNEKDKRNKIDFHLKKKLIIF